MQKGASMGTWGMGPFSNDDAADFLGDLAELSHEDVVPTVSFEPTAQLRSASAQALRRVRGADSEWAELWDEAGTLDEATQMLGDIERHLV